LGFVGSGSMGGLRLQTYLNTGIVPYDYADPNTKYRMKKKAIAFKIKLTTSSNDGFSPSVSALRIYIFDETGFPSNYATISQSQAQTGYTGAYLAKLDLSFTSANTYNDGSLPSHIPTNFDNAYYEQSADFKNSLGVSLFSASYIYDGHYEPGTLIDIYGDHINYPIANTSELYITCVTDNEMLNYSGNRRLKVGFEYEYYLNQDGLNVGASIGLQFMLIDNALSFNATNDVFT